MNVAVKENKMIKAAKTRKTIALFSILLVMSLFASGRAFAWTVSSTFEGGSIGSLANGTNGFNYAGSQTFYDNTHVHTGSMAAKMHWINTNGAGGFGSEHGEYDVATYSNEIWLRGYFYFPSGFNFSASPVVKFLRVKSNANYVSVFFNAGPNANTGKLLQSNEIAGTQNDISSALLTTGTWHCVEQYVKFGSSGIQRIWLDGVLVSTRNENTGSGANQIYIMTQWNGETPQVQDEWMDDLVVTTDTPANRDANNNPMIGLTSGSTSASLPAAPLQLKIIGS